ncbi:Farnesylcysteine lyase [Leucoagaricus sp. SymC.cos]|nr:Farnesylcysteine lyase [Leucoagaricus sp. SymC.cos]
MKYTSLLFLVPGIIAFEMPFSIPKFIRHKISPAERGASAGDTPVGGPANPRIAIIGAGAGGSSAAFWISKAKERFGLDVDVDVYERSNYIGGRSTTVFPYEDNTLPELELGASIFVQANKNLWRASDEFNLTRRDFGEEKYEMGLWDGEKVVFDFEGGLWGTVKVLWRYGLTSPKRSQDIVKAMIDQYIGFYSKETPKWEDIAQLSEAYGWTELTGSSTMEYLLHRGISRRYISELVEGATRVNYGQARYQNVDYIHALEGLCSLAANGAVGIEGGNFQIFEQFLKRSGALMHLNTTVTSILPKKNSKGWTVATFRGSQDYTAVILAAPFHSTDIVVPHTISEKIPKQPYVHLHVTLLTTTSEYPNPSYFALAPSTKPARMMLTTYEGVRKDGKAPEFNSLSYHGLVRDGEWAVKIFSREYISDEWLSEVFNGQVGWVFRKEWDAYPKLPPTTSFPPVRLDKGFYYVNSFEPFISAMETETVSSRNVVDLLLNEEFNAGICGSRISDSNSENFTHTNETTTTRKQDEDNYVYGWDC